MRGKIHTKIFTGAAFLLLAFLLFAANSFFGNPVTANRAKNEGELYLKDRYGDLDLKIGKTVFNPKDGSYSISVYADTSIDTHFSLAFRDNEIIKDNYEESVLSGMNTVDRFCGDYKNALTPLVQEKIDDVTHISVMPEKLENYDILLDSAFDKHLMEDVEIQISCTGGTDAGYLSGILKGVYQVMQEEGYAATRFAITGEYEKSLIQLFNIGLTHIESDNLDWILQKAMSDSEYDGIIAFSKDPRQR